jgi:prephenate dehydrogenase
MGAAAAQGLLHPAPDPLEGVEGADLVVLATPLGAMEELLGRIGPRLAPDAAVTDCGSAKAAVAEWARRHLGDRAARFIPGHPITGSEASGFQAARADLFRNASVILCPLKGSDPGALRRVRELWALCGARVHSMDPEDHDAVFAAVSHLPHVMAFALMRMVAQRVDGDLLLERAGPGFRDLTRLAGSQAGMWRDIALANREPLLRELERFQAELARMAGALDSCDGKELERLFLEARQGREALLARAGEAS